MVAKNKVLLLQVVVACHSSLAAAIPTSQYQYDVYQVHLFNIKFICSTMNDSCVLKFLRSLHRLQGSDLPVVSSPDGEGSRTLNFQHTSEYLANHCQVVGCTLAHARKIDSFLLSCSGAVAKATARMGNAEGRLSLASTVQFNLLVGLAMSCTFRSPPRLQTPVSQVHQAVLTTGLANLSFAQSKHNAFPKP